MSNTSKPADPAPKRAAAAPTVDPAAAAATREAQAVSSMGAQIILDYNSDAALGARGGAGSTIEENQLVRDAGLIAVGLDPRDVSGPPTGVPLEPPPDPPATRHQELSSQATRMTSLAAGGITGDRLPLNPPPAETLGGAGKR